MAGRPSSTLPTVPSPAADPTPEDHAHVAYQAATKIEAGGDTDGDGYGTDDVSGASTLISSSVRDYANREFSMAEIVSEGTAGLMYTTGANTSVANCVSSPEEYIATGHQKAQL